MNARWPKKAPVRCYNTNLIRKAVKTPIITTGTLKHAIADQPTPIYSIRANCGCGTAATFSGLIISHDNCKAESCAALMQWETRGSWHSSRLATESSRSSPPRQPLASLKQSSSTVPLAALKSSAQCLSGGLLINQQQSVAAGKRFGELRKSSSSEIQLHGSNIVV